MGEGSPEDKLAASLISAAGSWGGKPVGPARAGLTGWGPRPRKPSGSPRTFLHYCPELGPSEFQVLFESSRKCEVGDRGRGGQRQSILGLHKSARASSAFVLAGPFLEPRGIQWEKVASVGSLGPVWRD